jgi:MoxR-like ATPase
MPADILGTNMVTEDEKGKRYFEFFKGPIFGQTILADEINRATPKTQSALLEAMQEGNVTIFGKSHTLEKPFIVLATQNPLEMEGTYPLPEAQVDRFFYKLIVKFPNHDELSEIIDKTTEDNKPNLESPVSKDAILLMKHTVKQVPVASHVKDFAIRLLLGSHPNQEKSTEKVKTFIRFGASPRGLQTLIMAGKVMALLNGRFSVSTEDIKKVAKPALRHRIILNLKGEAEGVNPDTLIEEIINES